MDRPPDNDTPLPPEDSSTPPTGGGAGSTSGESSAVDPSTAVPPSAADPEAAAVPPTTAEPKATAVPPSASRSAAASYLEDVTAGEEDTEEWEDDDKPAGSLLPADFWTHVEDLRWVLIKSAATFFGAMVLVMLFSVRAQKLLTWPLEYGLRLSGSEQTDILLRTDGPFSVFTFMLQLWVFGGLLLSLPFVLYFAAGFIAPGLTEREKKMLRPVTFCALGLFLVGCLFAFFLLLPTYIAVSLSLEKVFGFASLWTPSNYYGAVVWTTLGMGVVFQFPLVLIMLQYIGLVSAQTLGQYRRHAIVFILIFAALLTPGGDPISLAVCALPLYALFELSMLVGERIRKRAAEAGSDAGEDY